MIIFKDIDKKYGNFYALKGINLELEAGKSYAVIGPNGSGKTTLIKCLLGLVKPTAGNITFFDTAIDANFEYRSKIGYMAQIGRYPENMTINQVLQMMQDIRGIQKIDNELISLFKLDEMGNKRMGALSGGTRQKVSAAIAYLFYPSVYVLDEPTAGLDPLAAEMLKDKIKKDKHQDKILIITSHIISDIEELADNIVFLMDGKLLFNKTINEVKALTGENSLSRALATVIAQKEVTV